MQHSFLENKTSKNCSRQSLVEWEREREENELNHFSSIIQFCTDPAACSRAVGSFYNDGKIMRTECLCVFANEQQPGNGVQWDWRRRRRRRRKPQTWATTTNTPVTTNIQLKTDSTTAAAAATVVQTMLLHCTECRRFVSIVIVVISRSSSHVAVAFLWCMTW